MQYNFCTLFDKNYLFKGLTLYNSLVKHCSDFKLWILCMDDTAYKTLKKMNLKKAELISLKEFEDKKLLSIKNTRTPGEYCWTSTSSLPLYIFKKHPNLEMIAYLDSDQYFYSSLESIYKEFGNKSVMIIPHKLSPENKHLEKEGGKYNVGMLIFRNNKHGLDCLNWWREKCLDWCYGYYDKGRYGDQMYLNDWPERFSGVHVLKHKGADIAPWNVSQYKIKKINNQIFIEDEPLIFFHFPALIIYPDLKFRLHSPYFKISSNKKKLIYTPYLEELKEIIAKVKSINPNFNYGITPKPPIFERILSNNLKLIRLHEFCKKRIPIYNKLIKNIKTW